MKSFCREHWKNFALWRQQLWPHLLFAQLNRDENDSHLCCSVIKMFFQKAEWDVKKLLDDNLCLIILVLCGYINICLFLSAVKCQVSSLKLLQKVLWLFTRRPGMHIHTVEPVSPNTHTLTFTDGHAYDVSPHMCEARHQKCICVKLHKKLKFKIWLI